MTCPKCQKAVEDGSVECPFCGIIFAKWKGGAMPPPASASPPPASWDMFLVAQRRPKKTGGLKAFLMVLAVASVIFAVAAATLAAVAYRAYRQMLPP